MDFLLANASQALIVVIFVSIADECHVMQQFIQELYKKEVMLEEEANTIIKREKELNTKISKTETMLEKVGWHGRK